MRKNKPRLRSFSKTLQEFFDRAAAPLSLKEQQRRYRRREPLPDWAWAIIVGAVVSGAIVGIMILTS